MSNKNLKLVENLNRLKGLLRDHDTWTVTRGEYGNRMTQPINAAEIIKRLNHAEIGEVRDINGNEMGATENLIMLDHADTRVGDVIEEWNARGIPVVHLFSEESYEAFQVLDPERYYEATIIMGCNRIDGDREHGIFDAGFTHGLWRSRPEGEEADED